MNLPIRLRHIASDVRRIGRSCEVHDPEGVANKRIDAVSDDLIKLALSEQCKVDSSAETISKLRATIDSQNAVISNLRAEESDAKKAEAELRNANKLAAALREKVDHLHFRNLRRPDVADIVDSVEVALVALCSVEPADEQSRQVICGVHELLQEARTKAGAAGPLVAGAIASRLAIDAYRNTLSEREFAEVF